MEVLKHVAEIFSIGASRAEDMAQLAAHNEALQKARDELAQQMKERTLKLTVANEQLRKEIVERERIEKDLVRLERWQAFGDMSGGVRRNLNNILCGVLLAAEMIHHIAEDPEILSYADTAIASVRRAADLIERVSKAVLEVEEASLYPLGVNDIIQEVLDATRSKWEEKAAVENVSLQVVTNLEDVPPVRGTKTGLYDILINLISNAVDALPEGGTIRVTTHPVADGVQITIADNGVGMDEERCKRIFDPFFTTKETVGSGLGLSIVYGTVTRWGGTIDVKSVLAEGTTFTVRLPAWAEDKS